ncbi:Pr6Pr family membrane protein [Longispora albida]|uniref:Pr6Pr family membrane protein n=1 Tax=Longispora albida TaxID=203523 RepID=UPI00037DB694|nr:Pr6Pr family membrane protein [Longispora albida]
MRLPSWLVSGYRVAFALLTLVAIGTQLVVSAERPAFNVVSFFSFFTNLSNIFAAVVFLASVSRPVQGALRGAAVVYMTVTGIVYALLLSGTPSVVGVTIPWVDTVIHQVMPVVVILDWLLQPPRARLTVRQAATWLLFPIVYLVYSLIRGEITGWYPYPFLNAGEKGYGSVFATSAGIAVAVVAISAAVWWLGNRLGARQAVGGKLPVTD